MQRLNYHGMNAGVREGLRYGSLILGLMVVVLMCLFALVVSTMQMPNNTMPLGRIPPVIIMPF